jgi:tetratricopeptide (TPR) repeat protein
MNSLLPVTDVLHRAFALHQAGDLDQARTLYRQILEVQPAHFDALHLIGVISSQTGDVQTALRWFDAAVAANPCNAMAQFNRGVALQDLKRWDEALASYDRALVIKPAYAEAHSNRGFVQKELLRFDSALISFDHAIALKPNDPLAYIARSESQRRLRQWDAALESCRKATAIAPNNADAYSELAMVLRELNRMEEAVASCERAISIDPGRAQHHCNLGNLLYEMHQLEAAVAGYDIAIALNPSFLQARASRAYALLLAGDFPRGWHEYEWRWRKRHDADAATDNAKYAQPRWLGVESLSGKAILLCSEQGLGDTIQFCRYASRVAALGARVILEVPQTLFGLLQTLDGVAQVHCQGDPLPAFDYYCSLPSLPALFNTTTQTIPAGVPYLSSSASRRKYWTEKMGPHTKLRVGLIWSGGFRPSQPELWGVDSRRNVPLTQFAILNRPEIEFYSLQKGQAAEAQLSRVIATGWDGPVLMDFAADLQDFTDTAALIEQLDLVISVDTSTAHLAGALGKPVWLLNRFDTCWRWMLGRSDSPWYPTLKIYRQERRGDWDTVMTRVATDLEQWVRHTPVPPTEMPR